MFPPCITIIPAVRLQYIILLANSPFHHSIPDKIPPFPPYSPIFTTIFFHIATSTSLLLVLYLLCTPFWMRFTYCLDVVKWVIKFLLKYEGLWEAEVFEMLRLGMFLFFFFYFEWVRWSRFLVLLLCWWQWLKNSTLLLPPRSVCSAPHLVDEACTDWLQKRVCNINNYTQSNCMAWD